MWTRHIHHKEGPLYRADVEEEAHQAAHNGRMIGFRVTSERTGDTKKFVPLVKETVRKKGNVGLSRLRLKEGAAGHRAGHKPEGERCNQL
ncbi:MAG: hypothetical protein QW428_05095 [Conexivisphaerales archaeon]